MGNRLKIYTDGGARGNPGPAAFGVVITDEKDKVRKHISFHLDYSVLHFGSLHRVANSPS